MGTVYKVRHRELGCVRAVKQIPSAFAPTPEVRRRFRLEARALAALAYHRNAVTVHDAWMGEEGGYIEMEYVDGKNLKVLLADGFPLSLSWATTVVPQICDVLHHAHQAGIIHRDLKPANLMLHSGGPDGQRWIKVVDFGLAGFLDGPGRPATDRVLGSPAYASPEQLAGDPVDARSDIYSLGVVIYQMLTNRLPIEGRLAHLLCCAASTPPERPTKWNPAIPGALEDLLLDCLAKDPGRRPATATIVAERFLAAA